jgi:hypothetical protein
LELARFYFHPKTLQNLCLPLAQKAVISTCQPLAFFPSFKVSLQQALHSSRHIAAWRAFSRIEAPHTFQISISLQMELLPSTPHTMELLASSLGKLHKLFFTLPMAIVGPLAEVFSTVS